MIVLSFETRGFFLMAKFTRRDWMKTVGSLFPAATVLTACHNSTSKPDAPGPDAPKGCSVSNAAVTIEDNHAHAPHMMVVTAADVMAGVDKTYDIQGAANHNHQVTVTAAQFQMLQQGGMVSDESTVAVCHMHKVDTSCG
jgi:hypothetical protein